MVETSEELWVQIDPNPVTLAISNAIRSVNSYRKSLNRTYKDIRSLERKLRTLEHAPSEGLVKRILNAEVTRTIDAITSHREHYARLSMSFLQFSEIVKKHNQINAERLKNRVSHQQILRTFSEQISAVEARNRGWWISIKPLLATLQGFSSFEGLTVVDNLVKLPAIHMYIPNTPYNDLGFFPADGHYGYDNGYSLRAPHPHILGGGAPCLGDFYPCVRDAQDTGDILGLITYILQFLQSIDPCDSAGRTWIGLYGLIDERETYEDDDGDERQGEYHFDLYDLLHDRQIFIDAANNVFTYELTPAAAKRHAQQVIKQKKMDDEYAAYREDAERQKQLDTVRTLRSYAGTYLSEEDFLMATTPTEGYINVI